MIDERRAVRHRNEHCTHTASGAVSGPVGIMHWLSKGCERRESNPDPLRDRILSPNGGVNSRQEQTTRALWLLDLCLGPVVPRSQQLSPVPAQFRHSTSLCSTPPRSGEAGACVKAWSPSMALASVRMFGLGCLEKNCNQPAENIGSLWTHDTLPISRRPPTSPRPAARSAGGREAARRWGRS